MKPKTFSATYLDEASAIIRGLDTGVLEDMASALASLRRRGGRLFILGVGGGAAHSTHAVSDMRMICGIQAFSPADNLPELTARANDDGWPGAYAGWLDSAGVGPKDAVLVFSVSGGDPAHGVSGNLVKALDLAKKRKAAIYAVTGPDGGHAGRLAKLCLRVPQAHPDRVTLHTEGFQAMVWHLLAGHPRLQARPTRWEAVRGAR